MLGNRTDKRLDCQRDLFVTDPLDVKKALKRKKGGHAPGTCEWILRTTELTAWLNSVPTVDPESQAAPVLWLHGNPGTGKSILAIYLTEELPEKLGNMDGGTLIYFFCDSGFDTQRTATSVIRGLLYQLIRQHQQLLDYLMPEYRARGKELFKSFDTLWDIFMTMVTDQSIGRTYCIIDALDECDLASQRIMLQRLEEQFDSRNDLSNVRIMVTSRPYSEIRESLQRFPNKDLASFYERQKDIDLCISEKLRHIAERKRYTDKVYEKVRKILKEKAEGTFLWIGLACDELKDIPSNRTIQFLQGMPKGLHALYRKLINVAIEHSEAGGGDIQRLMSCVAICSRPLTVLELSEACQLHQEEEDVETRIQFTHDYIESCRLLIIIQDKKVLLLHQSVRDYLVGTSSGCFIEMSQAHARLAYRCIDVIIERYRTTDQPHTSFSDYATLEWANHARMAKSNFQVQPSQAQFFQIDSSCREQWLKDLKSNPSSSVRWIPTGFSIFHVAAEWGIPVLVDYASGMGVHLSDAETSACVGRINCKDGDGRVPLDHAAMSTHINVVAALLNRGGKVTARVVVSAAGNEGNGKEVMALLLDRYGDRITITDSVLMTAARNRNSGKQVISLLLDRYGEQITITDKMVKAAAAYQRSGKELISLFLNRHRDHVIISDETVSQIARIFDGEVMTLLLDRRGDQITISNELVIAAAENVQSGKEIMALLLDRYGDHITITERVLKAAAGNWENGPELMALLLDHRGDQITITDEVVKAAADNIYKSVEVMELLLDRCGDQITITDEVVKVAVGVWENSIELVTLLLDRRGDQVIITDEVLEAADDKFTDGKQLVAMLLDRRIDQITITDEVATAAECD